MRHLPAALSLALLAAVPLGAAAPQRATVLRLDGRLPDRDTLEVTLRLAGVAATAEGSWATHSLALGGVVLPVATPALLGMQGREAVVSFKVRLRDVPEAVLDLPTETLRVAWNAAAGERSLAAAGDLAVGSTAQLEVSDEVRDQLARLGPLEVAPSLADVGLRALLEVYNPFSFDLVTTRMAYRLSVGQRTVTSAERPGGRFRALQRSDLLIEQSVPLASVASALADLMAQQPARLDGSVTLRTPKGEREFPFGIAAGQ